MDQGSTPEIGFSESKLMLNLYENVITGKLTSFSDLKAATSKLPVNNTLRKCLFKAFVLQKRLYWGFFSGLTQKKYPGLWHEIVLPDPDFRFGGDLKRSMSIPEIYLGLLDIHGYTRYCQSKKRNMSMVDLLDRMIYEDVDAICSESGVISRRAQGDEILILGPSALDVLKAVMQIMDYFNTQGRSFRNTVLSRRLPGTVLPKFQISAGIAGGQKFTPLVITRDGDLSGDIVNTAARLQAKANKISPEKNRILITNHVYQKLRVTMRERHDDIFNSIGFFNIGSVEFKGVDLRVYDIVFLPSEQQRLRLRGPMENLYNSLEKKQWKSRILKDALSAAEEALQVLSEIPQKSGDSGGLTAEKFRKLQEMIKMVRTMFDSMFFEAAVSTFSAITETLARIDRMDRIVLEYLELVSGNYTQINDAFISIMDNEAENRLNEICTIQERDSYLVMQKHSVMFKKLQSTVRLKLNSRRKTWALISDEMSSALPGSLRSLK